jgi:MFS family permease
VFTKYKSIFRRPGAAAFCAAAFVMRMPIAMYPLGIILIISARDGKYGFAGVLSACYVFGGSLGMPALSVLVDRFGQRRVLLPSGAVHAAAVIALAVMLRSGAPNWLLVVPTVVFGFSYLSVGSLVRARWSHLLTGRPELATALSAESVLDELIFVVGPLLATVIATQVTPDLVLYLAVALVAAGTLWLAGQRATEPPPHPRGDAGHTSALREPGVAVLTLATVAMGAVFASAEVAMVAFCGQHGQRSLSGLVLACMAGGSAVSGLLYGVVEWRAGLLTRFRTQALIFAALPVVLLAAFAVPVLAVCAFVLGLGIAPTLINAFGLVQQIVPVRALTEGLTWINTGLGVGYGAGAALVGGIADRHGARTAFLVVIGAALLTGMLALAVRARPTRVPTPETVSSG